MTEAARIDYRVQPGGRLSGRLRVPGDKSMSHRAVMLGALARGTSVVDGLLEGEDVLCTLAAFREMGVHIEGPRDGHVEIEGVGLHGLSAPARPLDMGGEIAVTQVEPALAAELCQRRHEIPRLPDAAPAGLRIGDAGQRVHHGVEVR